VSARWVFLFLFLLYAPVVKSQVSDTSYVEQLNSLANDEGDEDEDEQSFASDDTLAVDKRSFNEDQFEKLRSDNDLDYSQVPTVGESLWERFMRWLSSLIESLFKGAVETNWGRVIVYAIGVAVVVVLVMMILKVDAFKVLFFGANAKQKYQVLEENIHEMDFDKLITESIQQQDYRRGIRLLFLYSLKLLSDKQLIHWESGKTNHDYVAEISVKEIKPGFNQLSYFFDYAWYGNFSINRQTFDSAHQTFTDLKNQLR
jgi:hypothetical protein